MQRIDMKTGRTLRGGTVVVAAMVAIALLSGCAEKPDALIASAKEYLAKNDRNAAVIQLKNALQNNPDLAEARFLLGKALFESGDFAAADKELRKARELKYSNDQTVPLLARVLVAQGEFKKVVDEFSKVEVTGPESKAELQTAVGEARVAMGDVEAARAAFAAAVTAVSDYPPALLGQARLKAGAGDLAGALMLVESALAKSPTLTDGWRLKGDIVSAQGKLDDALAEYRKALTTRADYIPAHSKIVAILIQQGKTEDAGKQLAAMQKVAPKHPQTLYLQALLAFREKNYAAAHDAIQQQLRAAPNNLLGLLLGAQIDYQLGSYAQTQSALETVLRHAPNQTFARRLLVQSYLREGKPTKALDAIKPLLQQAKIDSDTLTLAGEVYVQNGDTAAAARYFDQAAKLDPKGTGKRAAAALLHFAKGEIGISELEAAAAEDEGIRADLALFTINIRQRKFEQALAAVAAIEKKQPDKPLSHSLRGMVFAAKGDMVGARKSFERALAVDPSYFPAIAYLARLDVLDKKPEEATKRFEAVLAKDPKNAAAFLAIADLRSRAGGSMDDVAALIGKAIAANPNDTQARLALMSLYLHNKEPKKAVAAAQDALAAMPDRAEILDAAGQAYRAAGDVNQAIATYNKLATVWPDSPLPYIRIAETHVAAKNNTAALENLRKALAIKPDLIEARAIVVALDLEAGRVKEALASARELQKQNPARSIGYMLEGDIYARQSAWSEAIPAYRNGLKRVGTTDLAIRLAVALRGGKGGDAEAEKFIASWIKDHPNDRVFLHYVAESAIKKKDYAGAARQYKAMLENEPSDALALNNLAYAAGQLKDPRALEYAEKADKLAPNNPAVMDTLGMLLIDKGDTKRGVEMLQKAAVLAPNAATIHLNLARALIKDGQKEAAKKELDALAKLGDKFSGQAEVAKLMQSL
jgi:putative PEP-CTERM system TPR-repeat lipoprotein